MNTTTAQVSVIYGDEDFLIERHLRDIIKRVLGDYPVTNSYALEILEDERATITHIINACQSMGMFSTDKVVVVKNFFLLNAKTDKEISPKDEFELENLQQNLKNIDPGTRLVFVNNGNVDNRKKFVKFLKSFAAMSEYKSFASWEGEKVIDWIKTQVKTQQKTIEEKAAYLLYTLVGENLRMLDSEIRKIITYIGSSPQITPHDVEIMASSASASAFMLLDTLVEGNAPKSMALLQKILHFGEEPIKLLGLLVSHFRGELMVKSLSQQSMQFAEVAKLTGKHPFIVKNIINAMKHLSVKDFIKIMNLLAKCDLNIKTGQQKPDLSLELLCYDILAITSKKGR